MDLERDKQRLESLDHCAEELSKSIQQLRQETKRIVVFSNDLELKYKEQIESSKALLVHFELCESRANSERHRSGNVEGSTEDSTKSHLLVKQVLNSYKAWIDRSHDRRKRHAKVVSECHEKIDSAVTALGCSVWANGFSTRSSRAKQQVGLLENGEKNDSEVKDDSIEGSIDGDDQRLMSRNGKAAHVLEKELVGENNGSVALEVHVPVLEG